MISTKIPAVMKSAPLVYTGAAVSRLANMAMMGCQASQYQHLNDNILTSQGRNLPP